MEDKKKAPVATECFPSTSTSKVPSFGGISSPYEPNTIKSDGTLQADLTRELDEKFTPKKLKSLELANNYDDISLDSRSCDSNGEIVLTRDSRRFALKAGKVRSCGSFLEFHQFPDKNKLSFANFCKDRLCPMCNWRRSMKIFGQLSEVFEGLKKSDDYKDLQFVFLTLTIRNVKAEDFSFALDEIQKGWRKLYHKNKLFTSGIVAGSFRSVEITYSEKKGFHPHLHVILAVRSSYFEKPNYLTQKQWSALWADCMNLDYIPVVDIRRVRQNPSKSDVGSVAGELIDYTGGLLEVSKYAVKSSDFLYSPDVTKVFADSLESRQLIGFTGCFSKIRKLLKLDDAEEGDLVHTTSELEPEVKYIIVKLRWNNGVYLKA